MSEKPSVLETIRSLANVSSIASSIEPRSPAAKTATNETSASPIISAAAVAAVRPGLRTAFSRANRPGTPLSRSSGRPTSDASGATRRGLNRATPMNMPAAPTPIQASPGERTPNSPSSIAATPSATSTTAAALRRRRSRGVATTAPSRRPVTGGTRVARSAGSMAATTVSTVPSTSPRITVRGVTTVPVAGRSISIASNSALITRAKPIPASTPTADASSPVTNASVTTEPRIWRRLAPSVRSIANSRVRWATVIEKVLKIRNEATNSETPAKISSAVLRMSMNSPTSSRCDSTFCAPVSAWTEFGSSAERLAASSSGEVPSAAATWIWSS